MGVYYFSKSGKFCEGNYDKNRMNGIFICKKGGKVTEKLKFNRDKIIHVFNISDSKRWDYEGEIISYIKFSNCCKLYLKLIKC